MRQHRFTVAVTQTQLATLAELQRRWALPSRAAVVREVIARAALDQLVRDRAEPTADLIGWPTPEPEAATP